MTTTVVSALDAGRADDATALVFEYMAATLTETGRPTPASITGLPAVLRRECRNLPAVYCAPGALLVADYDGQPAGCVGLAVANGPHTAEIKRLYVRPAYRRRHIASILMSHAHEHAARHDLSRLVLDVLPARAMVIDFYRRLGYTDAEPPGSHPASAPASPVINLVRQ